MSGLHTLSSKELVDTCGTIEALCVKANEALRQLLCGRRVVVPNAFSARAHHIKGGRPGVIVGAFVDLGHRTTCEILLDRLDGRGDSLHTTCCPITHLVFEVVP